MPHLVRGAGEHYLPLPNARLVEPQVVGEASDVVVFAPPGTPVHAVCAGTVGDGDGATLRIEGEDGHTCVYTTVQERRVAAGERVDAGAIVGVIGADGDRHVLRLAVTDRHNAPVRPHELLLGAVDPNDLGYGPAGTGTDLDPDASSATRARTAAGPAARMEAKPKRQPPPATSRAATPSTPTPPGTPQPATARAATPRPPSPRPTPPRPAPPVPPPPITSPGAAAPEREPEPALEATEPTLDKEPAVAIPPPPPPVPLIDTPKDDTDEEPSAPSRSEEQQRSRAAMLIASRRKRPDTGSQR